MKWAEGETAFNDQAIGNTRTSETPVRSYWRCDLADGSKLDFAVGPASSKGFMLTISHTKITNLEDADNWRSFWKQTIARIGSV